MLEEKRQDCPNTPLRRASKVLLLALGLTTAIGLAAIARSLRQTEYQQTTAATRVTATDAIEYDNFLPPLDPQEFRPAFSAAEADFDCIRGYVFCADVDSNTPQEALQSLSSIAPTSSGRRFEVLVMVREINEQ